MSQGSDLGVARQLFRGMALRLRAAWQESAILDHGGMIVEAREAFANKALASVFPGHVRLYQNAAAINAHGRQSGQCDIVVASKSWPPLLDADKVTLLPVELVFGAIEVSSYLDAAKLVEDCDKIKRLKSVPKTSFSHRDCNEQRGAHWHAYGERYCYFPTSGVLFGYAGSSLKVLGAALERWCRDTPEPSLRPDAVFVVGQGALLWFDAANSLTWSSVPGGRLAAFPVSEDGDDVFSLLAAYMSSVFMDAAVPHWWFTHYMTGGDALTGASDWTSGPL